MQKTTSAIVVVFVFILFIGLSANLVSAGDNQTPPPRVQIQTGSNAIVNGQISNGETGDYVTNLPMYIAGDSSKLQAATAFLVYNPSDESMYVRVEVDLSEVAALIIDDKETWVSIDGISNKVAFTQFQYLTNNQGVVYGYEASFNKRMIPNVDYFIIIHVDVKFDGAQTAATIGFQGKIGQPIFVVPETILGTTIVSMFGAGGAFLGIRRHRKVKN